MARWREADGGGGCEDEGGVSAGWFLWRVEDSRLDLGYRHMDGESMNVREI